MFIPIPPRDAGKRNAELRRTKAPPALALVAASVAIAAAIGGAALAKTPLHLRLGTGRGITTALISAGIAVFVAILAAVIRDRNEDSTPKPEQDDSMQRAEAHADEDEEQQRPIALMVLAALAVVAAIVGAIMILSRPANAQGAPVQSTFVLVRNGDTIAVERVTRGRTSIQGDLAIRATARFTYVAELADGPSVPLLTFQVFGAGASADAAPMQSGSMRIGTDSVVIEAGAGGATQRVASPMKGNPVALINLSFALTELMIARARAVVTPSAPYTGKFLLLQGAGVPLETKVEFIGSDSAVLTMNGVVHRFAIEPDGRIRGGTVPSQSLAITRVTGAAALKISLGRPDYGAPANAPYTAEEVMVPTRSGHQLSGTLTIPKGAAGRVPAVVTITGSGQEDRDEFIPLVPNYRPFRQFADTLGRRGVAVLRLDDRGINGSGGDLAKATSADFADDIRAGVAFLRTRREIDGARIALFGHSEGGLIGPMVAATDPGIAALVIFAGPAYTGRKILDFQLRNLVMGNEKIPADKKDSAVKATFAQWDSTAGKGAWTKFFLDYDPLPTLKKVRMPVLILQGGTDQQVTPEQAPIIEKTLKDAGNRDVTMHVFANRNHLFLADTSGFPGGYTKLKDGHIGGDVYGPLADWLVVKLTAPAKPKP